MEAIPGIILQEGSAISSGIVGLSSVEASLSFFFCNGCVAVVKGFVFVGSDCLVTKVVCMCVITDCAVPVASV